jgi:predicted nucleic acid-binding Zn ribbon protein
MIPISNFGSSVVAAIIRRQPASKERTTFAWQLAVGPALARATTAELSDEGILIVSASDPRWLAEVDRARDTVLQKMQHLLGREEVKRIRTG